MSAKFSRARPLIEIEKRIFVELRASVLEAAGRIRRSSSAVAEADLLVNFAHLAALRRYVRPIIDEAPVIEAVAAVIRSLSSGWKRRAKDASSPTIYI